MKAKVECPYCKKELHGEINLDCNGVELIKILLKILKRVMFLKNIKFVKRSKEQKNKEKITCLRE